MGFQTPRSYAGKACSQEALVVNVRDGNRRHREGMRRPKPECQWGTPHPHLRFMVSVSCPPPPPPAPHCPPPPVGTKLAPPEASLADGTPQPLLHVQAHWGGSQKLTYSLYV